MRHRNALIARLAILSGGLLLLPLLGACHGVSLERTNAQAPAKYHIEYYQISER